MLCLDLQNNLQQVDLNNNQYVTITYCHQPRYICDVAFLYQCLIALSDKATIDAVSEEIVDWLDSDNLTSLRIGEIILTKFIKTNDVFQQLIFN